MFKSFNNFTKEIYNDLEPQMKKLYRSEAKHRVSYLGNNGFTDWLTEMNGHQLSKSELNSVVGTYVKFGDRKAADIPFLLRSLNREHNIEIPVEEGIATKEYWESKLNSSTELSN